MGVGLKLNEFKFDYAFEPNDDLSDAHYFTLAYRFGIVVPTKEKVEPEKPEEVIEEEKIEPIPEREPELLRKFKIHSDLARQFVAQKKYQDALLEIKLANSLLWDKDNIKLEIQLLLELDYFIEAATIYYKFIEKFPELKYEIDFEKYY